MREREQSELLPATADFVAALKVVEEQVLRLLDDLADDKQIAADRRWLATGRIDIEKGFQSVTRSIEQPERVSLPEDEAIVETAWVLERADSDPSAPLYYAPWNSGETWSQDHQYALRLARREDAERLAISLAVQTRVAEHQWG